MGREGFSGKARPTIASWSSLDLMNKGRLLPGCQAAPLTCAALDGSPVREKLAPVPGVSEEVGVRLLRLDAGASIDTHEGPGGRLVAMEYVTLPAWNPDDPFHAEIMKKTSYVDGSEMLYFNPAKMRKLRRCGAARAAALR